MGAYRAMWPLSLCLVLAAGCPSSDPYAKYRLGAARDVVAGSVQAIGGLEPWQDAEKVHVTAVVTCFAEDGRAITNRQQQTYDLEDQTITATAETPNGRWSATVGIDGKVYESDNLDAAVPGPKRTIEALAVMLHRVLGPLNFLEGLERPHSVHEVRVAGEYLDRVTVMGDNRRAVAYYFDRQTHLLRLVTSGADSAGREGTVTLYQYRMLPDGRMFPGEIRVVNIGRHVLIGQTPVLTVEFSDVRIE